jgi:hypothetical protein
MANQIDLNTLDQKIEVIKKAAKELVLLAGSFPAVAKNTARILASLKMLELNVSDVIHLQASVDK